MCPKRAHLDLLTLPDFPLVCPGDDLAELINTSLRKASLKLENGDVLVIAQKIVSKAENRYAYLNEILPTTAAENLALEVDKDPRLVQLILDESKEVVAKRPGVLIVEHRMGYVHANAGIDHSNISSSEDEPRVLLLPKNPDKSAAKLCHELKTEEVSKLSIIINDSAGRAWRNGSIGFAIGTNGFEVVENMVGHRDLYDREMVVTEVAVADELAAAASFLMGQADESAPVVLIRGAQTKPSNEGSAALIREKSKDLFR